MKRKICELILIIVFFVFQCTLGRAIAIGGVSPNFMIILPVIFGFLNGRNEGIYVGLICGLFYDLFSYDIIGFSSLTMMYAGYASGFFYQKYEEKEFILPLLLVGVSSLAFGFISFVGNFLLHNKLDVVFYIGRIVIPEVVYTVCVTLLIYQLLAFLNRHFEGNRRKRAKSFDERNI